MLRTNDNPNPVSVTALCIALVLAYIITPSILSPLPSIGLLATSTILSDARRIIPRYCFFMLSAAVFLSFITGAAIYGGADIYMSIVHSLRAFALIATVCVSIILLRISTSPLLWVAVCDRCHIPRKITYVVVTSATCLSLVNAHGRVTLNLLRSKGYSFSSARSRFGAYARIISPVFASLLTEMRIHAQSLYYRDFFHTPRYQYEPDFSPMTIQWIWIVLSVFILLLGGVSRIWF